VPLDSPIRVLLVDDNETVRSGLSILLEAYDDLALAGEADDGESAIALCAQVHADVIIMDVMMPGMSGIQAARLISDQHPHLKIILLSTFLDTELLLEARQSGALAYLPKSLPPGKLIETIRAAFDA
jgi:DNA-binding NarL/FixJ family response regulator